jgi:hypothetical protein
MAMWNVTLALVNLPLPLVGTGQPVQALQLAGFATDFVVQRFGALPPDAVRELRRMRRLARHQVGGAACNAALAAGQQLTLAEAVGLALRAPDGD